MGVQVYPGTPPAKQVFPAPPTAVSAPPAPGAWPKSSPEVPIPPQPPDYANIPPAQPASFPVPPQPAYLPPSWSTAPSIATVTAGIAAGATSGPWQSWDVTGIVQSWITQGYSADGGLVLASSGAPVRFASSAGRRETVRAWRPIWT